MKQAHVRQALREVEINKLIAGSPVEQFPEHLIDLILYFTYSYQLKNRKELRSDVEGYPQNIKKYGNISYWDVSNVTNMRRMFNRSQFQGDISKWEVSNVTNMSRMFNRSQFQGDISKWEVSNVTYMKGMFHKSQFQGDISRWAIKP